MTALVPTPSPTITGSTLVDLDVTIRVVGSEIPVRADIDVAALQAQIRDYMARQTARSIREIDEAATIAVTVVLREV